MNIFTRYTLLNLKKNKTRTIVTIIGIILSVAMFTAVTESIVSGQNYLLSTVAHTTGSFEFQYREINKTQLDNLLEDKDYKEVAYTQNIGYAMSKSQNEYKPYIRVLGMSENYTDLVAVRLLEGRMPENNGEIVLAKHYTSNGGVSFKVGDVLTLEVGSRAEKDGTPIDGDVYFTDDEKIVDTQKKVYTVVGICSRPDSLVEKMENPGFTAYTHPEKEGEYTYNTYFTSADPHELVKKMDKETDYGVLTGVNDDILMFEGVDIGSAFITGLVFGMGAILILIIMAGSIALIYNSFSISVTERTKQFGILRSIGATDKQMVRTVLTEGLILCGIAIPFGLLAGCGGMAVTFRLLAPQFSAIIPEAPDVVIRLIPNAPALIIAAVISIVTTLISAIIPARRAMKKTAIEAVRMTGDIADKGKTKNTDGKLMNKLFGFSGMLASRNFARNRKKYRTTIISLAMSLILFISASSISYYFTKSFDLGTNFAGYDIDVFVSTNDMSAEEARKTLDSLSATEGVEDYMYYCGPVSEVTGFYIDKSYVNEDYDAVMGDSENEVSSINTVFVNEACFRKLCSDNSLNVDDYINSASPAALLYDKYSYQNIAEDGKRTIKEYKKLNSDKYPLEINALMFDDEGREAEAFEGIVKDGKAAYFVLGNEGEKYIPVEEAAVKKTLTIGAEIKEMPLSIIGNGTVLIYPENRMNEVYGKTEFKTIDFYGYYKAPSHAAVNDRMTADLENTPGVFVNDNSDGKESAKAVVTLISVFSYGFITLISLIAVANVFNTVSTNIMLRRRELAMLKSVGMSGKDFRRMTVYESMLYGIRSLVAGLPISLIIAFVIYFIVSDSGFEMPFSLPWGNIIFAVISVFAVVTATMVYSMNKLKKYNTADELKNENI